jgi:hypothetical protein
MAREHVSVDLTPDTEEGLSDYQAVLAAGALDVVAALAALAAGGAAGVAAIMSRKPASEESASSEVTPPEIRL